MLYVLNQFHIIEHINECVGYSIETMCATCLQTLSEQALSCTTVHA